VAAASLHLTPDRYLWQQPPLNFFTSWMLFLPPNQQRQSTEGRIKSRTSVANITKNQGAKKNQSKSVDNHNVIDF